MTDDRPSSADALVPSRPSMPPRHTRWWAIVVGLALMGAGIASAGMLAVLLSDSWAAYEDRLSRLEHGHPASAAGQEPESASSAEANAASSMAGTLSARLENDMAQIRQSLAQVQNQMMQWDDNLRQRGYNEQNTQYLLFALALGQARWGLDAKQEEFYRLAMRSLKESLPSFLEDEDRRKVSRLLTLAPRPSGRLQESFAIARQALVPASPEGKATTPARSPSFSMLGWWDKIVAALSSVVTITRVSEADKAPHDPRQAAAQEMEAALASRQWEIALRVSEPLEDIPAFSALRRDLRERVEAESILLGLAQAIQAFDGATHSSAEEKRAPKSHAEPAEAFPSDAQAVPPSAAGAP